jgi:hypothetical protein
MLINSYRYANPLSLEAQVAAMFTGSDDGFIRVPSDLSTLFQESTGQTAVTASGQSIGLALDKRLGPTLGSELITNGTFDTTTTGWTGSVATLSVSSGKLAVSPNDNFQRFGYQTITTVVGHTYKLSFDYDQSTASSAKAFVGTSVGSATNLSILALTGAGSRSAYFVATATTTYIQFGVGANNNSGLQVLFDNISVKEVPGNHGLQATSTARPTLNTSSSLNYIDYDAVDDKLTTTFAASLGSACTIGRSIPGSGASISTGQTIGTSLDESTDSHATVVINRALTGDETTTLTAFLNQQAGL